MTLTDQRAAGCSKKSLLSIMWLEADHVFKYQIWNEVSGNGQFLVPSFIIHCFYPFMFWPCMDITLICFHPPDFFFFFCPFVSKDHVAHLSPNTGGIMLRPALEDTNVHSHSITSHDVNCNEWCVCCSNLIVMLRIKKGLWVDVISLWQLRWRGPISSTAAIRLTSF